LGVEFGLGLLFGLSPPLNMPEEVLVVGRDAGA
jgi:hypothetical protein